MASGYESFDEMAEDCQNYSSAALGLDLPSIPSIDSDDDTGSDASGIVFSGAVWTRESSSSIDEERGGTLPGQIDSKVTALGNFVSTPTTNEPASSDLAAASSSDEPARTRDQYRACASSTVSLAATLDELDLNDLISRFKQGTVDLEEDGITSRVFADLPPASELFSDDEAPAGQGNCDLLESDSDAMDNSTEDFNGRAEPLIPQAAWAGSRIQPKRPTVVLDLRGQTSADAGAPQRAWPAMPVGFSLPEPQDSPREAAGTDEATTSDDVKQEDQRSSSSSDDDLDDELQNWCQQRSMYKPAQTFACAPLDAVPDPTTNSSQPNIEPSRQRYRMADFDPAQGLEGTSAVVKKTLSPSAPQPATRSMFVSTDLAANAGNSSTESSRAGTSEQQDNVPTITHRTSRSGTSSSAKQIPANIVSARSTGSTTKLDTDKISDTHRVSTAKDTGAFRTRRQMTISASELQTVQLGSNKSSSRSEGGGDTQVSKAVTAAPAAPAAPKPGLDAGQAQKVAQAQKVQSRFVGTAMSIGTGDDDDFENYLASLKDSSNKKAKEVSTNNSGSKAGSKIEKTTALSGKTHNAQRSHPHAAGPRDSPKTEASPQAFSKTGNPTSVAASKLVTDNTTNATTGKVHSQDKHTSDTISDTSQTGPSDYPSITLHHPIPPHPHAPNFTPLPYWVEHQDCFTLVAQLPTCTPLHLSAVVSSLTQSLTDPFSTFPEFSIVNITTVPAANLADQTSLPPLAPDSTVMLLVGCPGVFDTSKGKPAGGVRPAADLLDELRCCLKDISVQDLLPGISPGFTDDVGKGGYHGSNSGGTQARIADDAEADGSGGSADADADDPRLQFVALPGWHLLDAALSAARTSPSDLHPSCEAAGLEVGLTLLKGPEATQQLLPVVMSRLARAGIAVMGIRTLYPTPEQCSEAAAISQLLPQAWGLNVAVALAGSPGMIARWQQEIGPSDGAVAAITDPLSLHAQLGSHSLSQITCSFSVAAAWKELSFFFMHQSASPLSPSHPIAATHTNHPTSNNIRPKATNNQTSNSTLPSKLATQSTAKSPDTSNSTPKTSLPPSTGFLSLSSGALERSWVVHPAQSLHHCISTLRLLQYLGWCGCEIRQLARVSPKPAASPSSPSPPSPSPYLSPVIAMEVEKLGCFTLTAALEQQRQLSNAQLPPTIVWHASSRSQLDANDHQTSLPAGIATAMVSPTPSHISTTKDAAALLSSRYNPLCSAPSAAFNTILTSLPSPAPSSTSTTTCPSSGIFQVACIAIHSTSVTTMAGSLSSLLTAVSNHCPAAQLLALRHVRQLPATASHLLPVCPIPCSETTSSSPATSTQFPPLRPSMAPKQRQHIRGPMVLAVLSGVDVSSFLSTTISDPAFWAQSGLDTTRATTTATANGANIDDGDSSAVSVHPDSSCCSVGWIGSAFDWKFSLTPGCLIGLTQSSDDAQQLLRRCFQGHQVGVDPSVFNGGILPRLVPGVSSIEAYQQMLQVLPTVCILQPEAFAHNAFDRLVSQLTKECFEVSRVATIKVSEGCAQALGASELKGLGVVVMCLQRQNAVLRLQQVLEASGLDKCGMHTCSSYDAVERIVNELQDIKLTAPCSRKLKCMTKDKGLLQITHLSLFPGLRQTGLQSACPLDWSSVGTAWRALRDEGFQLAAMRTIHSDQPAEQQAICSTPAQRAAAQKAPLLSLVLTRANAVTNLAIKLQDAQKSSAKNPDGLAAIAGVAQAPSSAKTAEAAIVKLYNTLISDVYSIATSSK